MRSERKEGEQGRGRKRAAKRRTARLGAFVAVAHRRPFSACVQGDGAAWRGREASGEPKDGEGWGHSEGAARGRRRDGDAITADNRARRWTEGKIVNKTKFQNSSL